MDQIFFFENKALKLEKKLIINFYLGQKDFSWSKIKKIHMPYQNKKKMKHQFLINIFSHLFCYLNPVIPNFFRASLIFSMYVWNLASTSFSRSSSLCRSASGISFKLDRKNITQILFYWKIIMMLKRIFPPIYTRRRLFKVKNRAYFKRHI